MTLFKRISIRLKITLAFSIVFTLLSFCLNLYCYDQIKKLIIKDNNDYLLERAKSFLDKTEVNPVIIPLPDKNVALKIYSRHSSGQRTLIFQSPGAIQNIALPRFEGVSDTLNMRVAYAVSDSEENPAELLIAVSNEQVETTLRYLFFLLVVSSLISVVLSAFISYSLARFFLIPIARIINTAKNINSDQLRETVPVPQSKDELRDLAETINGMLARIDKSLQQQQNFFASASHELKTPLAILRTELELNLKKAQPGELKEFLNSQLDEVVRLQNVVQEFLVISQIREGKLKIQPEQVDLSLLLIHVFHQLKPLAKLKRLKTNIHFNEETDGFFIPGDKDKINMVLLNILENAIKYSMEESSIECTIGGHPEGKVMEIIIRNKTALQATDTSMLGQAFYRGDVWQHGSGIGLWLCSEIIAAHHGSVQFESADFTFSVIIRLPALYRQA